ncbi:sec1 family domain-containing protein 2-like isoform X2 [Ptychodera flava]|uniref:sec1 family domain-containing protein 2-like isoform X2 n=1 Tax=Ptychodera flava TaxID=63121 RepID=UPI00396A5F2E
MAAGIRSIASCSSASWEPVFAKVKKAVVFMDNATAECLHWNGGVALLFASGALDVKEFSSFESGEPLHMKAVFIVSTPLIGQTADIIKDIITASHFQYCIAITTVTAEVHCFARTGGYDASLESELFYGFEDKMLQWMRNMNYTAEVVHVAIVTASVCPSLFITPSYASLFPLIPTDAKRLQNHRQDMMFVCSMSCLFEMLNVNEDCYAVGPTSRIIASELASLQSAKNRRKTAPNRASVVFIDRTLDLVGPTGHHGETLADKIISLLPRLPGHSSDVGVNMADLCSTSSQYSNDVVVPGCLAHPRDGYTHSMLNTMVTSKQKECLMEINRQLVEAASQEGLPLQLTGRLGRVNADTLQSHLKLFKGEKEAFLNHAGLLQLVMACIKTLKHDKYPRMEKLLSVEKMIILNTGDSDCPSALSQIKQIMETEKSYDIEDILLLLVFVHSLIGDESHESLEEERQIKNLLMKSILSQEDHSEVVRWLVGYQNKEDGVRKAIFEFYNKLKGLNDSRSPLRQFRSILESQSYQSEYKPILKQIVDEIFNPNKPDLVDIEYKSSGLKDLLKSGFGLFMTVSKPRPNDHPLLVLFIVGGVTCSEVRQIKEAVAAHKTNIQVVVGSTSILKPTDIIRHAFSQDNLFLDDF